MTSEARTSRAARVIATALLLAGAGGAAAGCATMGGGAPSGSEEKPDADEAKAMATVGGKAKGIVVWSSSRVGNHDLYVMNSDGSNVHAITSGDAVDWYPRFSPDGSRILFTRSKKGWVFERDANTEGKWDIYTVTPDGKDVTKVVDNASWGNWVGPNEIVFARATSILRRKLSGGDEELLVDSTKVPDLDGALLQQPEVSRDGKLVAITLRGSKRETGIWNVAKKTWTRTGEGCQINWTPDGRDVYWVHPTGNGGSRVFHETIENGVPTKGPDADLDALTWIDIPGRRSHEYFPQLSADGKWLVWAATQRGHDHDIADYEIYLWEVGTPPETATRLTYHSGNDRWPDIFLPGAASAAVPEAAAPSAPAAAAEEAPLKEAAAPSKKAKDSKKSKKRK